MKKLFLTGIALTGMLFFVACGDQTTETEQEQNDEIIQDTEDDLLDRIEEEEEALKESDSIEPEVDKKPEDGVTEVEVKTLKN